MSARLHLQQQTLAFDGGPPLSYAIGRPESPRPRPLPLVIALHFGWEGKLSSRQGRDFLRLLPEPAFTSLGAVLVAPNCPERTWVHRRSEAAVLALLDALIAEAGVDADRVLLTGFSLGGMGTWFLAARHGARFAAAMPIATVPVVRRGTDGGTGLAEYQRVVAGGRVPWRPGLAEVPLYVVNSRDDEIIPFAPVDAAVRHLRRRGAAIDLVTLDGVGHYESARYVESARAAVPWVRRCWAG